MRAGGVLGMYMLCSGFFQPLKLLLKPELTYPKYYIANHNYSLNGAPRSTRIMLPELPCAPALCTVTFTNAHFWRSRHYPVPNACMPRSCTRAPFSTHD